MSISPAANGAQRPAIQVHGLEKSYRELRVLRGVDFEVARGSIFALLGSNGAGKTTVVKILSTLLRADSRAQELADILADLLEQADTAGEYLGELARDDLPFDLLDALADESDPRMKRFRELMRERGWARWIRPERVAEPPGSSDRRSRPADRQDVSRAP
jgi:ATPase subunit of ABC transporter with duplicated ATPase domains